MSLKGRLDKLGIVSDLDGSLTIDNKLYARNIPSGVIGKVWYVDKTNRTTSGNGKTWERAFTTVTAALAAAGTDDVILIGPGFYTEAATLTLTSSHARLKIIGVNSTGKTRGPVGLKTPTSAGQFFSKKSTPARAPPQNLLTMAD